MGSLNAVLEPVGSALTLRGPAGGGEEALIASIAANERWAKVEDRTAATAAARRAFDARFPNENARRAHFQRMALRSAQVRRARAAGADDE